MSYENESEEGNETEQKIAQFGGQLHREWQEQFQKDNPSHQDRFKSADDPNFDIRFSDESSLPETGEITLNKPLDELRAEGKEEKLAAALKKQQIIKARLSKDGKVAKDEDGKVYIDILTTDYDNLSEKWKGDNKASAEITINLIEKQLAEGGQLDEEFLELASKDLHEVFLRRRKDSGAWVPAEQDKSYNELSEEEKEKDRIMIRKGIEMYAKK